MAAEDCLRFAPSRVEGLPSVTEVVVFQDRLELHSASQLVVVWLADIAIWPRPRCLWRLLWKVGVRPRWLPVGERDWFHAPVDRVFRFYTKPPVVVFMPNEFGVGIEDTCFRRLQNVIRLGGFTTWDLG